MLFAHRGLQVKGTRRVFAENTFGAFHNAAKCGIGFECDVRLSKDGIPVIVHDSSLLRTHGEAKRVSDMTASQLAEYNIPTAEEILEQFSPNVPIIFDLKQPGCADKMLHLCHGHPNLTFLYWDDDWRRPRGMRFFRARRYRFPPPTMQDEGIACMFNGSAINIGSIERALSTGCCVNLFSPDKRYLKRLLRLYGDHPRCTITI